MCKLFLRLLLLLLVRVGFGAEQLVWREEFNGSKLNTTYWTPEINFVRNVEAVQIYTNRPKNLMLRGGHLILTAHNEYFESTNWKPESKHWWESRKAANYTSGSINSKGKLQFRYGRVEIRAKIEHGRGVWPALWLIGDNPGGWPSCGEIDILEFVSQNPKTVHATLHYTKNGKYTHPTNPYQAKKAIAGDWHIYGMNWTPEKLELTFDGDVIFTHQLDQATQNDGKNPFRDGVYHFIINLALDGWAEAPVAADYPRAFTVDYVRLYQDCAVEGTTLLINGETPSTKTTQRATNQKAKHKTTPRKKKKEKSRTQRFIIDTSKMDKKEKHGTERIQPDSRL
ncbi:MAG: glycoside hydrolase family 16 protein [bacterium]|nr:glycoside hydrolase family 16 protein [bacterium]